MVGDLTRRFVCSAARARSLAEPAVALIHEAGNPYYDWLFGDAARARAALAVLYAASGSEIAASRVTLLLEEDTLQGLYVALPGAELRRCRLADALLLLGRADGPTKAELRHRLETARGLLADVPPEDLYLSKIGVVPSCRRRGLGGAILDRVMEEARALGHRRLRLDVWEGNEPALALYASRGFTVACERRIEALAYIELVRDLSPS